MRCYYCKHECGEWVSFECYSYACEFDLDCPVENEEQCPKYEKIDGIEDWE